MPGPGPPGSTSKFYCAHPELYSKGLTERGRSRTSMSFHDNGALAPLATRVSPSPARMSSTIKCGVVGYGYWGRNIVRNLQGIENVEIAAACDKSSTARRRVHKHHPQIYVLTVG